MKKLVTLGLAALMAGAMVMGASAEEKVDLNVIAAQYGQFRIWLLPVQCTIT